MGAIFANRISHHELLNMTHCKYFLIALFNKPYPKLHHQIKDGAVSGETLRIANNGGW